MNESDQLRNEIRKIDGQIEAWSPEKRKQGVSAIRIGLIQQGVTISADDDRVLEEFAAGKLQLDDLVLQFYGRAFST
ncbi:hypothetical protein [Variovorax sp. OK605]|uniref:hypothetical protein n=1 Tax=Variovorax sp. OK605 TaxID=1855317 RepID=UPI0011607F67|nr:hypothetical protein [Variovorax sp. OK605]